MSQIETNNPLSGVLCSIRLICICHHTSIKQRTQTQCWIIARPASHTQARKNPTLAQRPVFPWLCTCMLLPIPINPLSPRDASKASYHLPQSRLFSLQLRDFRFKISMKLLYQHMAKLAIFTHFKSSFSTTSRELQHQFAACSG